MVEVTTKALFSQPEAVMERLFASSEVKRWSAERPLPATHALTGHAGAMRDVDWEVSPPPELGPWSRRVADWISRRLGGHA